MGLGGRQSRSQSRSDSTTPKKNTTAEQKKSQDIQALAKYIKSEKCSKIVLMALVSVHLLEFLILDLLEQVSMYVSVLFRQAFYRKERESKSNLARLKLPYPEAVFEINYFRSNPVPFYTLASELYPGSFRPTPTHSFIKLLSTKGLLHMCFTQNIDTLERMAGVPESKIIEAHGSFATQRCIDCRSPYPDEAMRECVLGNKDDKDFRVPRCQKEKCGGLVKPDIVFFGEGLPDRFIERMADVSDADLLIIMGTSLTVHPFASLAQMANRQRCRRVLINLERVGDLGKQSGDIVLLGDCDKIVRELCAELEWEEELNKAWAETALAVRRLDAGKGQTSTKKASAEQTSAEKGKARAEPEEKNSKDLEGEVEKITEAISRRLELQQPTKEGSLSSQTEKNISEDTSKDDDKDEGDRKNKGPASQTREDYFKMWRYPAHKNTQDLSEQKKMGNFRLADARLDQPGIPIPTPSRPRQILWPFFRHYRGKSNLGLKARANSPDASQDRKEVETVRGSGSTAAKKRKVTDDKAESDQTTSTAELNQERGSLPHRTIVTRSRSRQAATEHNTSEAVLTSDPAKGTRHSQKPSVVVESLQAQKISSSPSRKRNEVDEESSRAMKKRKVTDNKVVSSQKAKLEQPPVTTLPPSKILPVGKAEEIITDTKFDVAQSIKRPLDTVRSTSSFPYIDLLHNKEAWSPRPAKKRKVTDEESNSTPELARAAIPPSEPNLQIRGRQMIATIAGPLSESLHNQPLHNLETQGSTAGSSSSQPLTSSQTSLPSDNFIHTVDAKFDALDAFVERLENRVNKFIHDQEEVHAVALASMKRTNSTLDKMQDVMGQIQKATEEIIVVHGASIERISRIEKSICAATARVKVLNENLIANRSRPGNL